MGAEMPAPRNPIALAGRRLRGAVPNWHIIMWGIGTPDSSQSLAQIQERETGDALSA